MLRSVASASGSIPPVQCVTSLIGNGKCHSFNNIKECDYDGGDCCRETCYKNCYYRGETTFPAVLTTENRKNSCIYECGITGYNCITDAGCADCINGKCSPYSKCFETEASILDGIEICRRSTTSHGDSTTSAYFCGKDPDFTFVHDPNNKGLHFEGCGLQQNQCTYYRCCSDVIDNDDIRANCNNSPRSATQWSPITGLKELIKKSCFEQYRNCFSVNLLRNSGQCCECYAGWTGYNCNKATCSPPCLNGTCTKPDTCTCDVGWSDALCNLPVCDSCVNGECTEPYKCECYYGWSGADCNTREI